MLSKKKEEEKERKERRNYTQKENDTICEWVEKHGTGNWAGLANDYFSKDTDDRQFHLRTKEDLRTHWNSILQDGALTPRFP